MIQVDVEGLPKGLYAGCALRKRMNGLPNATHENNSCESFERASSAVLMDRMLRAAEKIANKATGVRARPCE